MQRSWLLYAKRSLKREKGAGSFYSDTCKKKKEKQMKRMLFALSALCLLAGAAQAADALVAIGESGTKIGAGIIKSDKSGLDAEVGNMFGVANTGDVDGMVYFSYSDLAGVTLPPTLQAGTYTFTARIGNNGDGNGFSGLNDISSGTNAVGGNVAGFFTTLGDTTANKNNMYTEFNAISGVAYTAPTEAAPANDAWTTWTFTWLVAEGSSAIGTDPYFAVYTRTGADGGGNGFWDDSILSFTSAGGANFAPVAINQNLTIFPDTTTNITLEGTDIEGSSLTYEVTGNPENGTLVTNGALPNLTYTPDTDYQGIDSFTFTVNDGESNSAPATVTITVTNQVPTADAQNLVLFADTTVAITLTGSDPDSGPNNMTYTVGSPAHGSLIGIAPDLTYEPTLGYIGDDSFTFTVSDGLADSDPATVSITVNDPAVSGPATISVNFYAGDDADIDDHQLTGAEVAGLNNDTSWNNISVGNGGAHNSAGAIFVSTVLTDSDGDTEAATIAPSVSSTWFVGYCANSAAEDEELNLAGSNQDDLYNSYLALNGPGGDGSPADAAVLVISGLGEAYTKSGYNVIIYSDSDKRPATAVTRQSIFALTPEGSTNVFTKFTEDDFNPSTPVTNTFSGTFIEGDSSEDGTDYSNYVVFSNLTASGFSLDVYADAAGGRGAINGFQIVANGPLVTSIDDFGVGVVAGESAVAFSWTTVSGASYGVEATSDLVYGTWSKILTGIDGINGVLSVTNNITEDQQFFRVYLEE
jgi:hypothetical protein